MTQNSQNQENQSRQTTIVYVKERNSNAFGTAGFVLALMAIFLVWVPILGKIIWLLGFIFSFIGVFKSPKGLAIAGLAISLTFIILLIAFLGLLFGGAAFL